MDRMRQWMMSAIPGADLVQLLAVVVVLPLVQQMERDAGSLGWALPVCMMLATAHIAVLRNAPSISIRDLRLLARLTIPVLTVAAAGVLAHVAAPAWLLLCLLAGLQVSQITTLVQAPIAVALVAVATVAVGVNDQRWNTGLIVVASGLIAWLRRRLLITIEQLNDARDELAIAAVSTERQRFSRDLHDLLGHTLSVIVVAAQVVSRTVRTDPDRAAETAADIEQTGRRALREVRAAVGAYRSESLADTLAGVRTAMANGQIELHVVMQDVPLRPEDEALVGWTVREATTNVIRHSRASTCTVTIVGGPGGASVTVADDGTADLVAVNRARGGLIGLRQRVAQAHGTLSVRMLDPSGLELRVIRCEEVS